MKTNTLELRPLRRDDETAFGKINTQFIVIDRNGFCLIVRQIIIL